MSDVTDLDAIRDYHRPGGTDAVDFESEGIVCGGCSNEWPCDTACVLAALDAAEQDAARLAEALDRLVDASAVVIAEDEDPAYLQPYRRRGQEALRLHAERTQR